MERAPLARRKLDTLAGAHALSLYICLFVPLGKGDAALFAAGGV